MKNKNYIVLLSAFIACTSLGMATEERKQYLLEHFRETEQAELDAQSKIYMPKYLNPVIAVRAAIAAHMETFKSQRCLTVENVSAMIENRISEGVTQDVDKKNLDFLYKLAYKGIKPIALEVQDIKSFSILQDGTLICVEHESSKDDKFRVFKETGTMRWELLLRAQSDFCMPGVRDASYFDYIDYEGKQCAHGIANKDIRISRQGILILYHLTTEDIAEYLIKKTQESSAHTRTKD